MVGAMQGVVHQLKADLVSAFQSQVKGLSDRLDAVERGGPSGASRAGPGGVATARSPSPSRGLLGSAPAGLPAAAAGPRKALSGQ